MSSKASPFHLITTKDPTSWLQYLFSFQREVDTDILCMQLPNDTNWVYCVAIMDGDDILCYLPQLFILSTFSLPD